MTVAELIAELQKHPPDHQVLTWGDGDTLYPIEAVSAEHVVKAQRIFGAYSFASRADDGTEAIVIE